MARPLNKDVEHVKTLTVSLDFGVVGEEGKKHLNRH